MDDSGISRGKVIAIIAILGLALGAIWYFAGPKATQMTDDAVTPIETGLRGIDEARTVRDAVNLRSTRGVDLNEVRGLVESR